MKFKIKFKMRTESNPQQHINFIKGQQIEVSSDEEGFRGAWYEATIVEPISKKRKKLKVQYKTLVNEDGSTPLSELVDVAYIRPLPPPGGESRAVFDIGDVVDAGYRDGWWTGIVRKVLDGGCRYRVYFDNPPDVFEFEAQSLRPHCDWIDGSWVSAEKQQVAPAESLFSSGTAVEVNIDKQNARDAWFPAVVIKENGDNTFLVKYQSSGNSDEAATRLNVDSLHIQPAPPHYEDRKFELLDKVDAMYDSCWQNGLITKLLAGRRYNVYFKHINTEKALSHIKLRPHAEWIDGQWRCKYKEITPASHDDQKQFGVLNGCSFSSGLSIEQESSGTAEAKTEEKTPCSATVRDMLEQSTRCNEKTPSNTLPPSKKIKLAAPSGTGVHPSYSIKLPEEDALDVPLSASVKMPNKRPDIETLRGIASQITSGNRARFSKKPIVSSLVAAKSESTTPAGKKKLVSLSNSSLIRIKELPETRLQKTAEVKSQTLDIVTMKGRHTKSPFRSPKVSVESATCMDANEGEKNEDEANVPLDLSLEATGTPVHGDETLKLIREQRNLSDSAGGTNTILHQYKRGGSSQRRKRGRPRKLVTLSQLGTEAGTEDNGIQNVANETIVRAQPANEVELPLQKTVKSTVPETAFTEEAARVSRTDCFTTDMAIKPASKTLLDDDQPLSMWIDGMHSSASADELVSGRNSSGLDETNGRNVDMATVPCVKKAQGVKIPDENECVPFVKRSLVWNTIESMEIFQMIPQKPHFRPLADCKEEYREGSAIGIMVTFASLFEKITSLQFDGSESILTSILESLVDLEKHGFDVAILRNRVKDLLSIKDGKEELLNQSTEIERQIREHTDERGQLFSKINDIEKKITELQKELATFKSEMKTKENVIARLQSDVDSMNRRVNTDRDNFAKIASAPWISS
ncbi:DUF724 domain-containing protein 7 isoform X2 [Mercurialis annua]|uniref:DUF724 domain-containing protein 7 isoform X2 n=1 Tax=Mercurialis annua TaxID=3986 RepID=UPI00215FC2C1|nr:DUF724 domain-containing protein 7 isoform X2 [Mercurialis annua]